MVVNSPRGPPAIPPGNSTDPQCAQLQTPASLSA
jgi:hypothetical protein